MIANCKRCDRIFQKVVKDICPSCVKEQQELVQLIKNYLRDHPYATIPEVARETDIAVEDLIDLIEQQILILVEFPNMTITCERCGLPTQQGRFCNSCKAELVKEMANMTRAVKQLQEKTAKPTKGYYSK